MTFQFIVVDNFRPGKETGAKKKQGQKGKRQKAKRGGGGGL